MLDEAEAGTEGVKQRTEAGTEAEAHAGAKAGAGAGAGACCPGDAPLSPAAPEPEPAQSAVPSAVQGRLQSAAPPPQHGTLPMHTAAEAGPGRRGEYLRGEYLEGEREAWEAPTPQAWEALVITPREEAREARARGGEGLEERGGERAEGERAEGEQHGEQPAHSSAFGESFEACSARLL